MNRIETVLRHKYGGNDCVTLQLLKVDARDNVATALQDLPAGAVANYSASDSVRLIDPVRRGHKVRWR